MRGRLCALVTSIILLGSRGASAVAETDAASAIYGWVASALAEFADPYAGETVFRVLNLPLGGMSESVGSAMTGFPLDSSALTINPASSSMLDVTELAVTHNNWIADSKIENAVFATRIDRMGVAAGGTWFYVPFAEYDDFGQKVSGGYYNELYAFVNASWNLLQNYYFGGLSLGANLKVAYRGMPDFTDDEGNVISGSGLAQSSLGLMADLGALARFNFAKFYASRAKNAAVGIAILNLGPPVLGEALPTQAGFGISYAPIRPLTVSVDITQPINLVNIADWEYPALGLGVVTNVFDFLSIQGGLRFKSGNPRISVGSTVKLADVSVIANYSLDMTTSLKSLNRLSIEARLDLGDGGRYAIRQKVEDYYLRGLAEYAAGNVDAAIAFWEEALKLDRGFSPAAESRKMAVDSRDIRVNLEKLQKLE